MVAAAVMVAKVVRRPSEVMAVAAAPGWLEAVTEVSAVQVVPEAPVAVEPVVPRMLSSIKELLPSSRGLLCSQQAAVARRGSAGLPQVGPRLRMELMD